MGNFVKQSTEQRMKFFSAREGIDTILSLGEELRQQYHYRSNPKKFTAFSASAAGNYDEKNKVFGESLSKFCYEFSNLDPEMIGVETAFTFDNYERMYFAVIEEVINRTLTKSNIEGYLGRLAEVRNLADGDSANIDIRAKNVYVLSKVGRGSNAGIQRHYGETVTLTPTPREVNLSFDTHLIAAGRFDFGREIALASEGVQTSILIDIIEVAFGASNPIGNKLIENTYSEDDFRILCQRVRAFNGGSQTLTMGTGIALSKILPEDTNLRLELGGEYMQTGYIRSQFGNSTFELPQAVDADYELIIPNDEAVIISTSVDAPIKIGMTNVKIMQKRDTADKKVTYCLELEWDVKLASDAHMGLQEGLI